MKAGFYVVREYSHTDKRYLLSIESRCFDPTVQVRNLSCDEVLEMCKKGAQHWANFLDQETPKHKHFVIEVKES